MSIELVVLTFVMAVALLLMTKIHIELLIRISKINFVVIRWVLFIPAHLLFIVAVLSPLAVFLLYPDFNGNNIEKNLGSVIKVLILTAVSLAPSLYYFGVVRSDDLKQTKFYAKS